MQSTKAEQVVTGSKVAYASLGSFKIIDDDKFEFKLGRKCFVFMRSSLIPDTLDDRTSLHDILLLNIFSRNCVVDLRRRGINQPFRFELVLDQGEKRYDVTSYLQRIQQHIADHPGFEPGEQESYYFAAKTYKEVPLCGEVFRRIRYLLPNLSHKYLMRLCMLLVAYDDLFQNEDYRDGVNITKSLGPMDQLYRCVCYVKDAEGSSKPYATLNVCHLLDYVDTNPHNTFFLPYSFDGKGRSEILYSNPYLPESQS